MEHEFLRQRVGNIALQPIIFPRRVLQLFLLFSSRKLSPNLHKMYCLGCLIKAKLTFCNLSIHTIPTM